MNNKRLINQDIQKVIQTMNKLPLEFQDKKLKKILRKNARPVVKAARGNIPKATKEVHRYQDGKIIKTFRPGDLRRAIKTKTSRRIAAVFVGPNISRKKEKVSAWFGLIMEIGSRYITGIHYLEKAYKATSGAVLSGITQDVKKAVEDWTQKNKI